MHTETRDVKGLMLPLNNGHLGNEIRSRPMAVAVNSAVCNRPRPNIYLS